MASSWPGVGAGLALLLGLLTTCGGMHHADVIPTPFLGTVPEFEAATRRCVPEACPFHYRVRISDPTDREANVQRCLVVWPERLRLVVGYPAGLLVPAHPSRTARLTEYVDMPKDHAGAYSGASATCEDSTGTAMRRCDPAFDPRAVRERS
jgi:hypothetical protein